jgi:hypothetical protein
MPKLFKTFTRKTNYCNFKNWRQSQSGAGKVTFSINEMTIFFKKRLETILKAQKKKIMRSNPGRSASNANLLKIEKEKFPSNFNPKKSFDTYHMDLSPSSTSSFNDKRKNTTSYYSKMFQGYGEPRKLEEEVTNKNKFLLNTGLSKLLNFWNESKSN